MEVTKISNQLIFWRICFCCFFVVMIFYRRYFPCFFSWKDVWTRASRRSPPKCILDHWCPQIYYLICLIWWCQMTIGYDIFFLLAHDSQWLYLYIIYMNLYVHSTRQFHDHISVFCDESVVHFVRWKWVGNNMILPLKKNLMNLMIHPTVHSKGVKWIQMSVGF